ncbi:UNVERIFIED_ORG: hypothetical protein ABIB52_003250 [Arthrobacter sp. UYCu721]
MGGQITLVEASPVRSLNPSRRYLLCAGRPPTLREYVLFRGISGCTWLWGRHGRTTLVWLQRVCPQLSQLQLRQVQMAAVLKLAIRMVRVEEQVIVFLGVTAIQPKIYSN